MFFSLGFFQRKTPVKKHIVLGSKLAVFKWKLDPEDVELGKIWYNTGEREFAADSEYRIRFFIAFFVLELLDDLWTSFLPFWAVLTKNANFMDEYLENGASFWRAVVFSWSVVFSSTFWPKMNKIVRVVKEKNRKNLIFWYKIAYKKKLGIFLENRALSLLSLYHCLTSCKKLKRSLEPFLRKTIN